MEIERRAIMRAPELRADDERMTLRGYAAVFDQETEIGGWWNERIAKGAFGNSITGDVRALIDHDSGRVIGRTTSGTLRLEEDDRGLAVEIDLPDTQDGRDLAELVKRGDISGMSFGFRVLKQEWDESIEPNLRTLTEVELFEVSAVAFPAYDATELAMRSSLSIKDDRSEAGSNDQEGDAAAANRLGYAQRRARQRMIESGLNTGR